MAVALSRSVIIIPPTLPTASLLLAVSSFNAAILLHYYFNIQLGSGPLETVLVNILVILDFQASLRLYISNFICGQPHTIKDH